MNKFPIISGLITLALGIHFFVHQLQGQPSAGTSIVRVNVTSQAYNFLRPWQKDSPITRRALGAVLKGGRVLVTAELVTNATYIEIEMPATGRKITAKIDGVDYEANLATVVPLLDSPEFLKEVVPLEITENATVGDTLEIWQIEDTGTAVSTVGEILGIDVSTYYLDNSLFLIYHLKASLRYQSGSFTLPVVKDGKLAGLLLSYNSRDQTSTILAAPIISHFLKELEEDNYPGFPSLGIAYAQTLDDQLRGYVGLSGDSGGVYITRVAKGSSADSAGLQIGDVLLEVAGNKIDARGNYDHPLYGKLNLSHIVRGDAFVGDTIPMKILRDGKLKEIAAVLVHKDANDYLIDPYMFDRGPRFVVLGGLVFQELTKDYLMAWGDKWESQAPFKLIHAVTYPEIFEEEGRRKLVFLSRVLRTPTTLGYEDLSHLIVTQVNGKPINDIGDFETALASPENGIHRIEFSEYPRIIFVDAAEAEAINAQLSSLGIPEIKRLD